MFQGRMQRNSITFFSPVVKITCQDGRTNGACGEADIGGRKELECVGWPPARLLPSAQLEGNISLTCRHLSGPQHQPSGTEALPKSLRPKAAPGAERGPWEEVGGAGYHFQTCCPFIGRSSDHIRLCPYINQLQTQTGHGFFDHEACFKKMKDWK